MTPLKNQHRQGSRVRRAVVASKQGTVTAGEYTAARAPAAASAPDPTLSHFLRAFLDRSLTV